MNAPGAILSRLVSIPSTSGREEAACSYFADVLPSLGWERVETDGSGSVVARRGRGSRELVLLGHIDTVPGGPEHRLEGDILWGRGTVDAKGPLCAFAAAGGRVSLPPDWAITLVAATGEEADSRGALHRIPRHRPAACIIGEPSGTDGVTIGYRGSLRAVLAASDGGAHRSGDAGPITGVLRVPPTSWTWWTAWTTLRCRSSGAPQAPWSPWRERNRGNGPERRSWTSAFPRAAAPGSGWSSSGGAPHGGACPFPSGA